ncbi:MAG: hypothetical protein AB1449_10090 [Chloroflexota bacterium]
MRRLSWLAMATVLLALLLPASAALAQTYSFSLDQETVEAFWQPDGSLRLEYTFVFTNDAFASPIDFVDVGLPTDRYGLPSISATIDGRAIRHIAPSQYVSPGVELGLGASSIPPGARGVVSVIVGRVEGVLYATTDPAGYASGVFSPTWFDSDFVHGKTDFTVTLYLPPGVQPDEGRWYAPPRGWRQQEPTTGIDSQGRVFYQWHEPAANGYTQYEFGVAFPARYVPSAAVAQPSLFQQLGISPEVLTPILCASGFFLFMVLWIVLGVAIDRRRKLAYLPPKIAIEGHGIKRGLTAVEAAILLESPLDRILTMILFSVLKKNAARVTGETPLTVERLTPAPEGLRDYEVAFLDAVVKTGPRERQKGLQAVIIDLVTSAQKKMKGFSLPETRDYYRAIMKKAWQEVEQAGTPEVRSQRFGETLEWTMLDRDFEDRTRRTFQTGPVFVPMWWGNYRPMVATAWLAAPAPTVSRGAPGPSVSMPHLPGSDFAASLVTSVQNTAGNLVGNIMSFTSGVTSRTNPPPPPSRVGGGGFRGGGGHACACACACAGCACACAGGGR